MKYEAWTWQDMKARCIEAAETDSQRRDQIGPSDKTGFWPETKDEYRRGEPAQDVYIPPSRRAISRMWEFVGWVNTYLDEKERHEIYQYGRLQVLPQMTIRGFCRKIGLEEHVYRRRIENIFQRLAESVNLNWTVRFEAAVDEPLNSGDETSSSEKSPTYWRGFETSTFETEAEHTMSRFRPAQRVLMRAQERAEGPKS